MNRQHSSRQFGTCPQNWQIRCRCCSAQQPPKPTKVDLALGAVLLALLDQERALRGGERLSQHALPLPPARLLKPPLGVGEGVLGRDVAERGVDSGRAEARPGPVEPPGPEGGVLGLAEPDGLGGRGALGVAEAEVEGEVRARGRAAAAVQRGRRAVGGLLGAALLRGGGVGRGGAGWLARGRGQGGRGNEAVPVEEAREVPAGREAGRCARAAEEAGEEEHEAAAAGRAAHWLSSCGWAWGRPASGGARGFRGACYWVLGRRNLVRAMEGCLGNERSDSIVHALIH
jgi:hypothetical protein